MSKRKIDEVETDAGSESDDTTPAKFFAAIKPAKEEDDPDEILYPFKVSNMGRVESQFGVRSFGVRLADGYFRVTSKVGNKRRSIQVHRLVVLAFHGYRPSDAHDTVDHINNDRGDNRVENLCWETRSNQNKYSYARNVNRKTSGPALSKQVQCRRNEDEPWGEIFASIAEAAKKTGSNHSRISAAIKGGHRCGRFYWKYLPKAPEILEGEVWKKFVLSEHSFEKKSFSGHRKGKIPREKDIIHVSNLGRIKSACGLISYGSETTAGYRCTNHLGIHYSVHDLVARLFIGPPPSIDHTINHKDLNRGNNNVANLEWSTGVEQSLHSLQNNPNRGTGSFKRSKQIIGRKIGENEWTPYENAVRAAKILDLHQTMVSRCCTGRDRQTKGYEFRFAPDERDADLPGEVWKTIKIKFS